MRFVEMLNHHLIWRCLLTVSDETESSIDQSLVVSFLASSKAWIVMSDWIIGEGRYPSS